MGGEKYMKEPKLRFKADDGKGFPDWDAKRLGTLMSFKNGINASGDKFGQGIKCISVMDILNNPYIMYDVIKGSVDVDEKTLQNFLVEYGDAVFQRSSENVQDAGRANVYMDKENSATFSGFVIRGKRIANYEPWFMNAMLNTFFVRKQIMSKAQGAQHINIGQEILSSVVVKMPSLPEQQKIADFLSTIDTIIEKQRAMISAWEERKKGVMQKLFSQEVRFKADDGSDFPDWEEKRLGDVFEERTERSVGGEELLSVTISQGVIRQSDSDKRNNSSENKSNYKVVKKNDLAYNTMRMWQGAEGVSDFDGIVSPAYTVVTPLDGNNGKYFEIFFKQISMLHLFQRYSQGLTSDTWNLKFPSFAKIKCCVPCEKEQNKIVNCIVLLDTVIQKQKETLEKWQELKKGLLQQMFV
ncbi:MAG: restriction endonuclease subunit S [Escherichia coli]|nr:MAG: restriction endonuclease subunit S [Escherichia coli]